MPLTVASIRSRICCKTSKRGTLLCFVYKCPNYLYTKQSHVPLLEVLQQIREHMEAIAKDIVSDRAVTGRHFATRVPIGHYLPGTRVPV